MQAGRELDALVAEKVMGLNIRYPTDGNVPREPFYWAKDDDGYEEPFACPHYSTDISAAWEVVEKLMGSGAMFGFVLSVLDDRHTTAVFSETAGHGYRGISEEAPHAICLAALKAMGVEED